MGAEQLKRVTGILEKAGIPCCEEYAAAPARQLTGPVAAVGIERCDWEAGEEIIAVRLLSPRKNGGWACQCSAVQAAKALVQEGFSARVDKMEYRSGCDCFEAPVRCTVRLREPAPAEGADWKLRIDGVPVAHVAEFSAVRDGQRRMIGSVGAALPTAVTPPRGGWKLHLVIKLPLHVPVQMFSGEAMTVTVSREGNTTDYTGVCWDQTAESYTPEGMTAEYQGYALRKVEAIVG